MGRFVRMMTLVVGAVFASVATAKTVYVNADTGNDSWDGTTPVHTSGNHGPMLTLKYAHYKIEYEPEGTFILGNAENVYAGWSYSVSNRTIIGESRDGVKCSGCLTFYSKTGTAMNYTIANVTFADATSRALDFGNNNGGYRARNVVVSNCVFRNCRNNPAGAGDGGGAVLIAGSDVKFVDCAFEHCYTTNKNYGGAIYAHTMSRDGLYLEFTRCSFTDNVCSNGTEGAGGAIYCSDPEDALANGLIFTDCGFTNNYARTYGGVVDRGRILSAKNCTFVGNVAGVDGGVCRQDYGNSSVWSGTPTTNCWYDCTFISNRAERVGGVAACASSGRGYGSVLFSNCTFTANSSYGGGAVVGLATGYQWERFYVESFEDCRFVSNRCLNALLRSGVEKPTSLIMFAGTQRGLVRNCRFENNWSAGSCCGLYITKGGSASPVVDVESTVFCGNVCEAAETTPFTYGGVVASDQPNASALSMRLHMKNCLVVSNENRHCNGAVSMFGTSSCEGTRSVRIENCTIADNKTAGSVSHGLYIYGVPLDKDVSVVLNSIFCGNGDVTDATQPDIDFALGGRGGWSFNFGANCVSNCLVGACYPSSYGTNPADGDVRGNFVGRDPKFVHDGKHDYWLWRRSPAYATGLKQGWMDGAKDLAGNPMVDAKTGNVNRGCFAGCQCPGLLLLLK